MPIRYAFLLLVFPLVFSGCKRSKFGSEKGSIKHDGRKRTYLLHIPDSYTGSTPVSLVIALHGGVGSARNIEEQSGLTALSDQEGFLLCSPNGYKRTWNGGGCCGKAQKKDIDDVGFISALIDHLVSNYNIDPKRVYLTGMSNGAFMCYRAACEIPHKIAAIAPVAGTMFTSPCAPTEEVSVIHFHSYNDGSIPYQGGVGNGISDHYNSPLDSVLNAWSAHNGCTTIDSLAYDGNDYDWRIWRNGVNGSEVQLYITHDGGHSWPMGTRPTSGSDDPSQAVNANALMWAFFQAHPKP